MTPTNHDSSKSCGVGKEEMTVATLLVMMAWILVALILYGIGVIIVRAINRRVPGFQQKLADEVINAVFRVDDFIFRSR